MTFDYHTKYQKMSTTHDIAVIALDTRQRIFTGSVTDVARVLEMPEMTVCGYAEWGRPAKKLKTCGYFLRWRKKRR